MKQKLAVLLAGTALIISFSTESQALTLSVTDGTTTISVTDGGVGDINPFTGAISYIGGLGVWSGFQIQTGFSKPTLENTNALGQMDLQFSGNSTAAGNLTIILSDTGFILSDLPVSPNAIATLNIGGTESPGTLTYSAMYNSTLIGSTSNTSTTRNTPFSNSATSAFDLDSPYDLTQIVTITHTGSGITTGDASLTVAPVPEPSTMVLLGAGLLGLAIFGKRRMNRE